MKPTPDQITQLLARYADGDRDALERLLPMVLPELRRIAARRLGRERAWHTIRPSDLVQEAYVRLARQRDPRWENRAHFYAVAAYLMRLILVDYWRKHRVRIDATTPLVDGEPAGHVEPEVDLMALDEALSALETEDRLQAQVVELRYILGLSIEETAEALGIAKATVSRKWEQARRYLWRALRGKETKA
jgi:RNA polymerase sigma factor (TIGR02999 family)